VFRYSGVQVFRCSGVQVFRRSGVQMFRRSGVQAFRCFGPAWERGVGGGTAEFEFESEFDPEHLNA
jgi:hypothetical protein